MTKHQGSARDKLDDLLSRLETPYTRRQMRALAPPDKLGVLIGGLSDDFLAVTVQHDSDIAPPGRRKIIHPFGAVAEIRYQPIDSGPYTGHFLTGGIGLARCSIGLPDQRNAMMPGLAIKLTVTDQPSLNILAARSLEPMVGSNNFFEAVLTTHLPRPPLFSEGGMLNVSAQETLDDLSPGTSSLYYPLDKVAAVHTDGGPAKNPVAPHALHFKAPSWLVDWWGRIGFDDFRQKLSRLDPDIVLYEVFATKEGQSLSKGHHIGDLRLVSRFIAEPFGDKHLFFKHDML